MEREDINEGDIVRIVDQSHSWGPVKRGYYGVVIAVSECITKVDAYKLKKDAVSGENCIGRSWMGEHRCYEKVPTRHKATPTYTGGIKAGEDVGDYVARLLKVGVRDSTRKKWLETFSRCVLPDEVKAEINAAITAVLRRDVFEMWGINEHFEKGITNAILLQGPPGTGKTMIGESIAAVLNKNLMSVSSGDLQSNVPGQTERNMQKIFREARVQEAVILFDECDSILFSRDMAGPILSAEINCLLREIERHDGVVVLTTNKADRLDPALERRIIAKVHLPPPPQEARAQIWQNLLPPKMPTRGVKVGELAQHDLTGGEIKNVILLAARAAVCANDKAVTMGHITAAVGRVVGSRFVRTDYKTVPDGSTIGSSGDIIKRRDAMMGQQLKPTTRGR